jgi:hypothetical protein
VIRHPDDFQPDDVPSCSDLRLFSAGGGSELLEWDMDHASVRVRMKNIMQCPKYLMDSREQ